MSCPIHSVRAPYWRHLKCRHCARDHERDPDPRKLAPSCRASAGQSSLALEVVSAEPPKETRRRPRNAARAMAVAGLVLIVAALFVATPAAASKEDCFNRTEAGGCALVQSSDRVEGGR